MKIFLSSSDLHWSKKALSLLFCCCVGLGATFWGDTSEKDHIWIRCGVFRLADISSLSTSPSTATANHSHASPAPVVEVCTACFCFAGILSLSSLSWAVSAILCPQLLPLLTLVHFPERCYLHGLLQLVLVTFLWRVPSPEGPLASVLTSHSVVSTWWMSLVLHPLHVQDPAHSFPAALLSLPFSVFLLCFCYHFYKLLLWLCFALLFF